ncbi:hypothetical protein C815_01154 [Firmicutes bacterium M10-2]|nr:hypothetical protein C815_01154 [Firmicutes bacterium M10-2]
MKFKRLDRQSEAIKKEIKEKLSEVLESCTFIQGPNVKILEQELADFVGVDSCITCANGTDALVLAIKALDIKKNDVVFVPDFTFVASAEAIVLANAIPVFVDVDIETMTMDPKDLEEKIKIVQATMTWHPKAILTVDLFGNLCDYEAIEKVAKRYDLLIIEDAAQAFGSEYQGKKAGSLGIIGTTSFFPAKNVGCYGDGGAVFTNDPAIAEKIRSFANHGREENQFCYRRIGMNSRLDEMQAAILRVKLKHFKNSEIDRMKRNEGQLLQIQQAVQKAQPNCMIVRSQFTIRCRTQQERRELQKQFDKAGIPTMIYYSMPLSEQKAFEPFNALFAQKRSNSNTKKLCQCVLSVPFDAYLLEEEIEKIKRVLNESK